ncbi:MAG: polysaccharide deacetylase family protein [Clostridia bacterium]
MKLNSQLLKLVYRMIPMLFFMIAFVSIIPSTMAEGFQACHRVVLSKKDITQENKSIVRTWKANTLLDSVNVELENLSQHYVEKLAPNLQEALNKTTRNSRMDVVIRYSRTGLTWLSFLVQARVTYHRELVHQEAASRTYDMLTGFPISLADLFDEDSLGWDMLGEAVREQATAYFPDDVPNAQAMAQLSSASGLKNLAFTLHGMSLVLHIPAEMLYPERHSLIEVTIMYPALRAHMTERAQEETDNLAYYQTCALTFDDGPSRTNTSLVLNSLLKNGARATFFIIGNRIADADDIVMRTHDEGHTIGAHNWHHGNVSKSSAASLCKMVEKFDKALIECIGIPSRYNRVPYGLYPSMVKAKVGWPLIQWSLDTYDWRERTSSQVLAAVKDQISDGDIILCHDIKGNAPKSTERIIAYLEEAGYLLLTIDELFAKDDITLKEDIVYYRCTNGVTNRKEEE